MIALCPTCHGAVHGGELSIDDATLYAWKATPRMARQRSHIYVEPADEAMLLLGSLAVRGGPTGLLAFDFSPSTRLSFALANGDIFLLNLGVGTRAGRPVVQVVEGHVDVLEDDAVEFQRRPGRVRVTAPVEPRFLSSRGLEMMRVQEPAFATDGRLTMLDVEVVQPGVVRVQGIFPKQGEPDAIIVTRERLAFVSPGIGTREPTSLMGEGLASVLHYSGPIDTALFNMGPTEEMPAADRRPPPPPPFR